MPDPPLFAFQRVNSRLRRTGASSTGVQLTLQKRLHHDQTWIGGIPEIRQDHLR